MEIETGPNHEATPTPPPRLPLFKNPHANTILDSGNATPLHHTIASVPFRWEHEPGKPREPNNTTSSITTLSNAQRSLELPPRLVLLETSQTTVLESPYSKMIKSSSFRIVRKDLFSGSFRRINWSPERRSFVNGNYIINRSSATPMTFGKRGAKFERGLWGSLNWKRKDNFKGKREDFVGGGSCRGFTSNINTNESDDIVCLRNEDITSKKLKIKRSESSSSLSQAKPQFWATIYAGLKQVVPWRSKKIKKDGRGLMI